MARIHKIAVFISHIYGDYQRDVCQGVIDKALEYGYHVDIFTSNDENVLGKYATGESGILRIPNPSSYEGVLLSSSTYLVPELKEEIIRTLQSWDCPVIDINSVPSPFPGVLLDNNSPIEKLVQHLFTVHSLRDIFYLGNSDKAYISNSREYHYTNAMTFLGLPSHIKVKNITYSVESIRDALDELLPLKPQAIVCYNDTMAYTVMGELATRGIDVPGQIAVTGCDNLEFGRHLTPSLTSITFPAYELGQEAFHQLLKQLDHNAPEEAPIVKAVPCYGGSCGCSSRKGAPSILFNNILKSHIDSLESIYLKNMRMSATLQGLTDIDTAMEQLADFLLNLQEDQGVVGLKECYLCLYSDWEQISSRVRALTLLDEPPEEDKIYLKLAIRERTRLPECTFSQNDSLPEFLRKGGSQVYVYTSLYFGDTIFGYLCQSYEENRISYPFSFVSWLQNVDSMLQSISANKNIQLMLNRLEDIYSHDNLTGLLNLQSFKMIIPEWIKRANSTSRNIMTIVLDLDHLKQINDQHGHLEGNFAIQVLGQAITKVCSEDLTACRFGGDEFYLMGIGFSSEESLAIISRIQKYLEHYNGNSSKPYRITVSGGYALTSVCTEEALTEAFREADQKMYEQKRLRHQEN